MFPSIAKVVFLVCDKSSHIVNVCYPQEWYQMKAQTAFTISLLFYGVVNLLRLPFTGSRRKISFLKYFPTYLSCDTVQRMDGLQSKSRRIDNSIWSCNRKVSLILCVAREVKKPYSVEKVMQTSATSMEKGRELRFGMTSISKNTWQRALCKN